MGTLTVVGTGFRGVGQITPEAVASIDAADKFFYLGGDPVSFHWLRGRNASFESLYDSYRTGVDRRITYREMTARILEPVRRGLDVCAAFYGHPGVFVAPSHDAIRQARRDGFAAWMQPGVSAEDCLFADLGVDPALHGCQSYEASFFLVRPPQFDPTSALVLWQVGGIGITTFEDRLVWVEDGFRVLVEKLLHHYPPGHEVVLYEAALLPVWEPSIVTMALADAAEVKPSVIATMYVPPLGVPAPRGAAPGAGRDRPGSLVVVGTGCNAREQITPEAKSYIEVADRVVHLSQDPRVAEFVRGLNAHTTVLCDHDAWAGDHAGAALVERVLSPVRDGLRVCVSSEDHPGITGASLHAAVATARAEGFSAEMLPAISVADCAFAELGIDPGVQGCQVYAAADFAQRVPRVEASAVLVLLPARVGPGAQLEELIERLGRCYPADQPVTLFEPARAASQKARAETVPLHALATRPAGPDTAFVIAPTRKPGLSSAMVHRLGLEKLMTPPAGA